jgi:hypothetical protein
MSRLQLKEIFAVVALLIVPALSGCGSNPDTAPAVAAAIAIATPAGALPLGGTMQFTATVTDAHGNPMTTSPTWSVVHGGGTITSTGLFTAGNGAGTFTNTVVATIGDISAASTVTITAGALANITISPDTATLTVGATHQFTVVGKDSYGNIVPTSPTWSATAGSIDSTGMFTAATAPGTYEGAVSASIGELSDSATVVVNPGPLVSIEVTPSNIWLTWGQSQQFTAVGHDSSGYQVPITTVWSLGPNAGNVGTLSSSGLFVAGQSGWNWIQLAIVATSGTVSGTATVNLYPLIPPSAVPPPPGTAISH